MNDISRSNDSLMFVLREGLLKMLNSNIQDGSSSKKRLRLVYEEDSQCPVCFAVFSKEAKVFHCSQGHFTCGSCRLRLNRCPECRAKFIGRAIGFERTLCWTLQPKKSSRLWCQKIFVFLILKFFLSMLKLHNVE